MRITIEKYYEPNKDPNSEASKLDDFLRSLYGKGQWRRTNKGIEIIL